MALVRICDRCESDAQFGMLTISVGAVNPQSSNNTLLLGPMSTFFRTVDLCQDCQAQLKKFLDGELCLQDEEPDESSITDDSRSAG